MNKQCNATKHKGTWFRCQHHTKGVKPGNLRHLRYAATLAVRWTWSLVIALYCTYFPSYGLSYTWLLVLLSSDNCLESDMRSLEAMVETKGGPSRETVTKWNQFIRHARVLFHSLFLWLPVSFSIHKSSWESDTKDHGLCGRVQTSRQIWVSNLFVPFTWPSNVRKDWRVSTHTNSPGELVQGDPPRSFFPNDSR